MTSHEKILQLKGVIDKNLRSIINRDYYLLEVPYYTNIGDTLIWQGELDFLKTFPHKCIGMYSLESFKYPSIDEKTLIIFQGGGNFGDLWTKHHDFKMKVVTHYPKNEFLFMPQTVHFEDENNLKKCAEFLANYNVTICARDNMSYEILTTYFKNNVLLVPDMAFYMDVKRWNKHYRAERPLLFKRIDKELKQTEYLSALENQDVDISDWPTMYNTGRPTWLMYKSKSLPNRAPWLADFYCQIFYRPYLIRTAVKFLKTHTEIYTTRLHGAIFSVMLNLKTTFIDNSYGKNRTFYDTWLSDCDCITMK